MAAKTPKSPKFKEEDLKAGERTPMTPGGRTAKRVSMSMPNLVERTISRAEEIEADAKRLQRVSKRRHAIGADNDSTAIAQAAVRNYRLSQLRASVVPMLEEFVWVVVMELCWDPLLAGTAYAMDNLVGVASLRAVQFVDLAVLIMWTVLEFGGCGNFASFFLAAGLGSCRPLTILPLALAGVAAVFVARTLLAHVGIMPIPVARDEWRIVAFPPVWTSHHEYDGIIVEELTRVLWALGIYSAVLWQKDNVSANIRRVTVPALVVLAIWEGGFRNPTQVGADILFRRDLPLRMIRMASMCTGAFIAGYLFRPKEEDTADSD